MAKKSASFNLNAARIAEISEHLRTNANDVNIDAGLYKDAKEAAKESVTAAGNVVQSTRVKIMHTVASLAADGSWRPEEIKEAARVAGKSNSPGIETDGSLVTFITEIAYAAHPLVRDHFRALVSIVEDAWASEVEQNKLAPGTAMPIAKWAKRKYHALTGAMKAVIDGTQFATCEDFVEYAIECDPDHNSKKVLKRLTSMIDALRDFGVNFPVDDIGHAVETLERVTVAHLDAARAKRLAEINSDVEEIKSHTPVNTSVVSVTPTAPVSAPVVLKSSPFVTVAKPAPLVVAPVATQKVINPIADALNELDAMDVDSLLGDNLELSAVA